MPDTLLISSSKNGLAEALDKAARGEGLLPEEAVCLFEAAGPREWETIFSIARTLTEKYFQRRIHFFAPLYFSDICVNDCSYCGYKRSNNFRRKALTPEAFVAEARYLWDQGHRSILMVAAEHPVFSGPLRAANYLMQLQRSGLEFSVALEVGPYKQTEYRELAGMGVSRFVLYQETYNRELYAKLHKGPKEDFDFRYDAMGRALSAGIPEAGIGFLAGLGDIKEELAAVIQHARYLHEHTGKYPSTFALPRIQPARGTESFESSVRAVTDEDFIRLAALLKVAVPSAGLVVSTRETPAFRDHLLNLGIGVTHMSAGVHTETGGYTGSEVSKTEGQFSIQDSRSLAEMVEAVKKLGYQPCQVSGF